MVPPASSTVLAPPVRRKPPGRTRAPKKLYHGQKMSLDTFIDWEPDHLDGWKYEWVNGVVQSYERSMKPEEKLILDRILTAFEEQRAPIRGRLFTEMDFILPGKDRVRRPDLSYYTREQIDTSIKDRSQVPAFVIEIISEHDNALKLERKLNDYFDAGVQSVWLVMPEMEIIKVLPSRNHSDTYSCGTTCSAAPALPDFTVAVESIFGLTPAA